MSTEEPKKPEDAKPVAGFIAAEETPASVTDAPAPEQQPDVAAKPEEAAAPTPPSAEPPKKRTWKGFLSAAFSYAASAGAGAAIGYTARAAATAALAGAGVGGLALPIAGMLAAGIAIGMFRAALAYREQKKADPSLQFLSRDTAKMAAKHAAVSVVAGSLFMFAGDEIAEVAGKLWERVSNVFTGDLSAQLVQEQAARLAAEEAARQAAAAAAAALAEEQAARLAAEAAAAAAAEALAQEQAANALLQQQLADAQAEVARMTQMLAEQSQPEAAAPVVPAPEAAPDTVPTPAMPAPEAPAADVAPILPPQPDTLVVQSGDNLWNIVEEHYGLDSNAEIQKAVDAVAIANGLAEGTAANTITPGMVITLPEIVDVQNHDTLQLDWRALDAQTALRLSFG